MKKSTKNDYLTPEVEVVEFIVERGFGMVSQMVRVVNDMSDFCRKNSISDGSCGMRSLIDWIMSTEVTGDPYESALYTIISRATANEEDQALLKSSVLEPVFAPKRKTA